MLYLADNLAYIPYTVLDEPLFVIHHIDIQISVSGSNLLQTFKEVCQTILKPKISHFFATHSFFLGLETAPVLRATIQFRDWQDWLHLRWRPRRWRRISLHSSPGRSSATARCYHCCPRLQSPFSTKGTLEEFLWSHSCVSIWWPLKKDYFNFHACWFYLQEIVAVLSQRHVQSIWPSSQP